VAFRVSKVLAKLERGREASRDRSVKVISRRVRVRRRLSNLRIAC
jgi:hypothetical protein